MELAAGGTLYIMLLNKRTRQRPMEMGDEGKDQLGGKRVTRLHAVLFVVPAPSPSCGARQPIAAPVVSLLLLLLLPPPVAAKFS